jgi:methyl-accepting chemotaxis protein
MEETAKKATKKKFRIRLNTQWKMVLIGLVVVAAFLGVILGYILPGMQNNMMAQKKEKIKEEVQIAYDVVNTCYQKQASGALTKEAAQDLAKQEVGGLLYGTDNASYFWINDMTPAMVMHPIKPAMNGQDLTTYKDPTGALVFVNMVNVVKTQG